MDRIVDDGSPALRPSRYLALIAPVCAALLYIPNICYGCLSTVTRVSMLLVWVPALFSLYFNCKHALIPDCDFGFVKAVKPYNILAVCLGFAELFALTAQNQYHGIVFMVTSVIFSVFSIAIMFAARKGAEKWMV